MPPKTLTPAEIAFELRMNDLGGKALIEACDRATARGLTDEELQREVDDEDSVFWEDVDAIIADQHQSSRVS